MISYHPLFSFSFLNGVNCVPCFPNKVLCDCSHRKCENDPLRCTARFPGQCIEPKVESVKTFFSCLNRSDLNPFSLKKQKLGWAFQRIETCERRVKSQSCKLEKMLRSWLTFGLSDRSSQGSEIQKIQIYTSMTFLRD